MNITFLLLMLFFNYYINVDFPIAIDYENDIIIGFMFLLYFIKKNFIKSKIIYSITIIFITFMFIIHLFIIIIFQLYHQFF